LDEIDISDAFKQEPQKEEQPAPVLIFEMPKAEPAHVAPRIEIVKYTDKSFLLVGEDTYLVREELKSLGGIFRHKWNGHGAAWMFSERRREEIETFLSEFM
jgi:hypothetical protein